MPSTKAIVLLSGGIDSAVCLGIAKQQFEQVYALSFDYGQKHAIELQAAQRVAAHYQVIEHKIIKLGIKDLCVSALTDDNQAVPDYHGEQAILPTYVPARNTIFLSIALGWAETVGAYDIFFGAAGHDYVSFPDCRPEYIKAFEQLATVATSAGVSGQHFHIHAPLLDKERYEIIQLAHQQKLDLTITHTCYNPDAQGHACHRCQSCVGREQALAVLSRA